MLPVCVFHSCVTQSHYCVQFFVVFIWILFTLAGEMIEDFLRHECGELDVTTTASEAISQTKTVLMHHLVNGGGKTVSRI
jgi:hypothetical protein